MAKEDEHIRSLIALHVSDDLTIEESTKVEQLAREDASIAAEVAAMDQTLEILREAGAEASPVDDRPSLWCRLEPRLGPAGRLRRPVYPQWRTALLATAAGLLVTTTVLVEGFGWSPFGRVESGAVVAAAPRPNQSAGTPRVETVASTAPRLPAVAASSLVPREVSQTTRSSRIVVLPDVGLIVRRIRHSDIRDRRLPISDGVMVVGLSEQSLAAAAGIKQNDVLLFVDGRKLHCPTDLEESLREARGGRYQIELLRDGLPMRLDLQTTVDGVDPGPPAESPVPPADQRAAELLPYVGYELIRSA